MTRTDYLPTNDLALVAWVRQFYGKLDAHPNHYGVPAAEVKKLYTLYHAFGGVVNAIDAEGRSQSRTLAKRTAKRELTVHVRMIVNSYIRFNRSVTDQQRHDLGLNFPKNLPPTKVPRPTTVPAWTITLGVIREVTIHVGRDNPNAGTGGIRRGRPRGVASCKIHFIVLDDNAPPPKDVSDFTGCEIFTQMSYTLTFTEAQRGKKLWFILRWINTTGEEGPFSAYGETIIP